MEQLKEEFKAIWQSLSFAEPTPIQKQAFQPIMEGQSMMLKAPTGSGKTLAYLLPILNRIEADQTLQCLIFAPSQELVAQIHNVIETWLVNTDLKVQMLTGGANTKRQIEKLKDKPEIIVASPGRFMEICQQSRKLKLHLVTTVVFDEADYLFSDEHQNLMKNIMSRLMRDTQKIWVSATLDDHFKRYLEQLNFPVQLLNVEAEEQLIKHVYVKVNNRQKIDTLRRLAHVEGMKAFIFCEQIHEIDEIEQKLLYHQIPVAALHSQKDKFERQMAIKAFENDQAVYLITTDVASRGIDILDVPYIIHFNKPMSEEVYIHRSGRTGRMKSKGTVISLLNDQEHRDLLTLLKLSANDFEEMVVKNNQILPMSTMKSLRLPSKAHKSQKVSKKINKSRKK